MRYRELRSGGQSEVEIEPRIPNGFKQISIRFCQDRRLANSGRPGSASVAQLGPVGEQIVWRQGGGARSDHSLMRRRMVATKMRCCGFRSAPRLSGTAVGPSGTAFGQAPAVLGRASWCSRASTLRCMVSTGLRRDGRWSTSQADSAEEARTGRKMNPLATTRKGILRPFSHVS